ncbi:MAG: hypothetical protein Q8O10_08555 [candidate division Zixibacteria bacterium]|nr:hypothetical protein [candidate division Zixibacteria bacterium]
MSKILKIIEKWKQGNQPAQKEEVFTILNKFFPGNWECKSGSHVVVRHPLLSGLPEYGVAGEFSIAITGGRKVKHIYLKEILKVVEYLGEKGVISKEVTRDEEKT